MSRYRNGDDLEPGALEQPDLFCKNPDIIERLSSSRAEANFLRERVAKVAPVTVPYKYDEDNILKEISAYIDSTYHGHYVGEDNVQSLDLILATGHATGFNIGNILKYGSRFGKKRGFNRDDLLKVIHYAIFELYNQSTRTNE